MKKAPEAYRLDAAQATRLRYPPQLASTEEHGNNGFFLIPVGREIMLCMVSDGMGWEHVSVSLRNRTPTWAEMCAIKDTFWGEEECVIQFHPPRSEYVNNHEFCLHLWRPTDAQIPCPPSFMVGIK